MQLTKYKKHPMNMRIIDAHERYFQDRFVTYDTFFSFAFRKGKEHLKRFKKDGIYYINENHIIRYLRHQEIKEIRKNRCLELIDECKKRMNLATNNGNTWSDKTVLFGH